MKHLTLNTRHVAEASQLLPGTLEILRPLVDAGGGALPGPLGLRFALAGIPACAAITIYHGSAPITTSMLVLDAKHAEVGWRQIEGMYLRIGDRAAVDLAEDAPHVERPAEAPWLATVIFPSITILPEGTIRALADATGCIARTIAHNHYRP